MIYSLPPKVGDTLNAIVVGGSDIVSYSWNAGDKEVSRSEKFTVSEDLLGKTITVTVTDSEGNTATSDATAAVTGEAVVSEVKLDNITPAVGDKITASAFDEEGNDVSAQCTWQWFRVTAEGNVVSISNATKQSYTVGAIDRGAVLYCEATDLNGNLLKSNESSVMKATNVTEINVNGMTGQRPGDKDEFVAVAGDELSVELVPYGAGLDAGYQWYRGGAAIKGATEATYVPTTADVNLQLSVKVTIPGTAGYGISEDATITNESLLLGTLVSGATYSLTGTVTLDDVTCWELSNSEVLLDNDEPAVGDTITVKVPFDKNGDGDEEDTGDYLDLTSDTPDATVTWYRGSIEAKNKVGTGASYDVQKGDNGKALYVVVTGAEGTEFIGSCQGTTDEANKTVMNTTITRETPTVTSDADMTAAALYVMTKGTKIYANTKDNKGDSVKDENLTFQWYAGGAAIDGATSSSYTIGDDDIKKFDKDGDNIVTYRVVVNGKDGYTGSAKDTIDLLGATTETQKQTIEDISVKRGDYYLHNGDIVNAGDELKLATSFAGSLDELDVIWWFTAKGDGTDTESFTGSSFTVPSTAGVDSKISVSVTKKGDAKVWNALTFNTCTTNTTDDTVAPKKTSSLTVYGLGQAQGVVKLAAAKPTTWTQVTTTNGFLACAKALDSISVTFKVADRTVTEPEVGATMTATVQPNLADLTYKWEVDGVTVDSNDADKTVSGREAGEGANQYTIKSTDVNKKIKVTVTAGTSSTTYAGASIKHETEEVVASSRTISALKVLKYDNSGTKGTKTDTWYVKAGDANGASDFLNDKKDFVNKKSVTAIATDETYIMVALDSDGEIIDSDVAYNLYNFKSGVEKKVGSSQRFGGSKYFTEGDVAHFEVAPNQIGFVGSAVNYNLTSAVTYTGEAGDDDTTVALKIAPDKASKAGNVDEDALVVAQGEHVPFTATVTGLDGNPTIKWFREDGTTILKVGKTYDPAALTNGQGFYAEMTVSGTTYSSDVWTVATRANTYAGSATQILANGTLTATYNAAAPALTVATADRTYDQFGELISKNETLPAVALYTDSDLKVAEGNARKVTFTATGGVLTATVDGTLAAGTYYCKALDTVYTLTVSPVTIAKTGLKVKIDHAATGGAADQLTAGDTITLSAGSVDVGAAVAGNIASVVVKTATAGSTTALQELTCTGAGLTWTLPTSTVKDTTTTDILEVIVTMKGNFTGTAVWTGTIDDIDLTATDCTGTTATI